MVNAGVAVVDAGVAVTTRTPPGPGEAAPRRGY